MPETDTTELIREARALSADHDLEPALEKFRSARRAGDDAPDVHFDIGSVLTDLERYREARVEYGDAVASLTRAMETAEDYELARLFNDRGVAKALSGDLQASLADFDEAIALAAGWYPMASKSRGRVLLALRDYSGADRAYRTAIEQLPGDPGAHLGLARVHAAADAPEEALSEARTAIGLGQGGASPYLILARALRAVSGDDAEADAALATVITICEKDIVQRRDRPVALYLQAYAQLELRRYGEAAASFDEAIGLLRRGGAESSRLFAAYSGYGRALTCAERFGEALGACQRALELAPQSGEQRENALANLAYVLGRLGDVDQAISRIEEARAAASARERQSGPLGKDRPRAGNRGWGLLGTEAMIRVAAAEKYGDAESWSAAVGAFQEAAKAAGHLVRANEKAAYGGLKLAEGYARWQLGDLGGARNAFGQARDYLPEGSLEYDTADNARRRVSVAQSFRLPRLLPHLTTGVVVAIVVVATVLEATRRLNGGAWAAVVLGLALLGVASWCLPVIRTLKIGGAEFTKDIGVKENVPVLRLSRTPILADPTPEDFPRQTQPEKGSLSANAAPVEASYQAGQAHDSETFPETIAGDLEEAIARAQGAPDQGVGSVRSALRQASVYALGLAAGEVRDGHGTESDLLHFGIDGSRPGEEIVLTPVFTGLEPLQTALLRNPDWQTLSVLEINGGRLYDHCDRDVRIVIDPWTEMDFQLPSKDEADQARSQSLPEGSEALPAGGEVPDGGEVLPDGSQASPDGSQVLPQGSPEPADGRHEPPEAPAEMSAAGADPDRD